MRRAWILAILLGFAPPLHAEVSPIPGNGDPRIQSIAYDASEVVALRVSGGYAVTVRLSPDERIETVTLGDSASWAAQVNKRADSIVIKPLGAALPTNLTVITDQRSYNFALYFSSAPGAMQPYLVNFTYPASAQQAAATPVASPYRLKGDKALWPLAITDDGQFTTLRWGEEATLPAVYREDSKGHLALVNGTMRDGDYVIEGVPETIVFVLGKARASARREVEAP